MNYASLLALLAGLAFTLPFLVRLIENVGVPRSFGIVATLAIGIFLCAWAWLRWRLEHPIEKDSALSEPGILPTEPYIPEVFFEQGVFRGESLLSQGRPLEALQVYQIYRDILDRQGQSTGDMDTMIEDLEKDLAVKKEGKRASI